MQPKILIAGADADPHVAAVTRHLDGRGIEWHAFNLSVLGSAPASIHLAPDETVIQGVPLEGFNSVWYRRAFAPPLPTLADDVRRFAQQEFRELFHGALLALRAHWVSHPGALQLAASKPLQLHLARQPAGLRVPPTLITCDPDEARRFAERHGTGQIVAKGIGNPTLQYEGRSFGCYTSVVDERAAARFDDLRFGPCILQAFVPKQYEARVVVVGDELFAARMDTQADPGARVDWRLAEDFRNIRHEAVSPPDAVRRGCLALCRRLGLRFGAFDFVVTPASEWYFLEVNPNGQWHWLEETAGLEISRAIADELCRLDLAAEAGGVIPWGMPHQA